MPIKVSRFQERTAPWWFYFIIKTFGKYEWILIKYIKCAETKFSRTTQVRRGSASQIKKEIKLFLHV